MISEMKEIRESDGIGSGKGIGSPLLGGAIREGLSEEVIIKLGPKTKESTTRYPGEDISISRSYKDERTLEKGQLDMSEGTTVAVAQQEVVRGKTCL